MTTKEINALQRMEVLVASFDTNVSGYPVMVELGDGRIFKSVLRLDGLRDPPGNGDRSAVRAYGLELFQRLFDDTLADAFHQAWGAAQDGQQKLRLRLWLDGGDRLLHAIPWELLHYDVSGGAEAPLPIATDSRVIFSRYLSSNEPWGEPIARRPIRVLVIVSDPVDLGPGNAWPHLIPVGKEEYRRDLESRFYPLYSTGQIDYRFLEPASAEQLHTALQDGYDVVMYFGHGVYHPSGGGWLLLEDDETGEGRLYDGMTMARRLKQAGHRPALVILVGCETARQFSRTEKADNRKNAPPQTSASRVELTATSSLASLLVQHGGVPAVLAMQRLVDITLARTFSYFLSDQLLQHGVIDVAVNAARLRVYEQEHVDWSIPVLYMRSQDGRLFAPNPRLEYALSILTNYAFARWRGPEFIYLEALTVPPGEDWTMLRKHPEDAPSSQDALAAMRRTLAPDMRVAGRPENTVAPVGLQSSLTGLRWGAQELAQHPDNGDETDEEQPTVIPRNLVALVGAQRSGMSVLLQRMALDLADEACHGPLDERPVCPLPQTVPEAEETQTEAQEIPKKPGKDSDDSTDTTMQMPVSGMGLSELSGAERFAQRTIGIYVPLKGYEDYKAGMHRLEQLIIAVASQAEPSLGDALDTMFRESREEVRTFTDEPSYVFLLDGLDAVAEELRGEAARDIVELSFLLPDQHIILSCNQNVFPTPMFRSATVLFVLPINERMVLRYLRQRNPKQSMELFRQIVENGLLGLTTDPDVLSLIYWRLTQRGGASLTRAQLVDDFVSRAIEKIPLRYAQGDAAYQTMIELAWLSRWHHQDVLQLSSVFEIMERVRQKRDYNLENLFQILLRAGFLLNVGMHEVRFSHSLLASYCAALALLNREDWLDRLQDITVMCSMPYRQAWWEDTIYVLVGLLHNTNRLVDMFRVFVNVSYAWTGAHTLLVARCLAAMPDEQRRSLPVGLQFELLDSCVRRLWPSYNDAPERRAKIITSLASLNYPDLQETTDNDEQTPDNRHLTLIDDTLISLLVDRVRYSASGNHYDYTEVRIASARALLTRYSVSIDQGKDMQLYRYRRGEVGGYLNWLLHSWKNHEREKLREVLLDDASSAPERAIAAFALGDLGYDEDAEDARFLLEVIVRPDDGSLPDGWGDTIWAAADALILLDANLVAEQLADVLAYEEDLLLWEGSTRQLIYIAGRVRTQDKHVVQWLLRQFLHHPSHIIKARALRSFGWLSEALRSFGWLSEALQALGLKPEAAESPQMMVKYAIEMIALWDIAFLMEQGLVQEGNEDQGDDTRYLRRKAVESLAWIGDQETLFRIQAVVYGWDLELREAWYATSNAIEGRLGQYE